MKVVLKREKAGFTSPKNHKDVALVCKMFVPKFPHCDFATT